MVKVIPIYKISINLTFCQSHKIIEELLGNSGVINTILIFLR